MGISCTDKTIIINNNNLHVKIIVFQPVTNHS